MGPGPRILSRFYFFPCTGESHYFSFASLQWTLLTPMSKHRNPPPPGHEPPTKRSRKTAGFRMAHPQPSVLQPGSASSSSLFVTVSTDTRRCGVTSESRLLPPTLELSEPASISTMQSCSDPVAAGSDCEAGMVPPEEIGGTPLPETTAKAKRKRYTTNTVC